MRTIRYALAAAAAVAAIAAPSASAACVGVAVIVCDPQFSEFPLATDFQPVPVCAVVCTEVELPIPYQTGEGLCVTWSDQNGNDTETCLT